MSNDRRSGGPPRRRGNPSESAVQEKLARIRQRRAERQAARASAPPEPEPEPQQPAFDDDDDGGEAILLQPGFRAYREACHDS